MRWPFFSAKPDASTSKPNGRASGEQQALLVHVRFSDEQAGTEAERDKVFQLEDELITLFEKSSFGEFDGNEIGGGFFTLYMYGPSAQELWDRVSPILRRFHPPHGSYAIMRYGKPGATEDRFDLPEQE